MTTYEISQYLQDVLELEKHVYTLDKAADKAKTYINGLGHSGHIGQPKMEEYRNEGSFILITIGAIIGAFAGWVIFLIIFVASGVFLNPLGQLIGAVTGAIISYRRNARSVSQETRKVEESNIEENQKYLAAIAKDNARVAKELTTKSEMTENYNFILDKLDETNEVLDKLYELNIVHPKYRNMVAVASLYEYFETGRCTTFSGADGAYNLYESESRQDKIISQLDAVIYNLEDIRNGQFALYSALNEANYKIGRLTQMSELSVSYAKSTNQNSEIAAYNAQLTAQNTNALTWITIIDSIVD